jgi:predicted metal-binding membrane protein
LGIHDVGARPGLLRAGHPGDSSRRQFLLLTGLLVTLAWLALWAWGQSPYGRYLDHGSWTAIPLPGTGGHGHGEGSAILALLLYAGGWVLMTAAMMLPTTVVLLDVFRRLTRNRRDRFRLINLVVLGYLAAWLLFGVLAHLLDWGVSAAVRQSAWLGLNAWVLGAMVLGVAGVFQFTALKYRCLDQCRAPLSFVLRHWRGGNTQRQALMIGVHHGAYCVGCCWALMLLMFIVGTGSIGWMLLLAAVMAAEKNLPGGRVLGKPVGAALMAGAALLVFQHREMLLS